MCCAGDALLLERTKQLLSRMTLATITAAPAAATAAPNGQLAEDEQPVAALVVDAIERHVLGQLSDFTANFGSTDVRLIRGLIDVLRVAVQCRAPAEGISQVGCRIISTISHLYVFEIGSMKGH
jgi:hypothetical protein